MQHNTQREEWHRIKEKNPRLAARIEAKAAGADIAESDTEKSEDSSDDDDDDEVRIEYLFHLTIRANAQSLSPGLIGSELVVTKLQEELAEQAKIDTRFVNVLSKIRQKDKSIYDSKVQIYPGSESEDGEDKDHSSRAASRKAHLKDVLAKQVRHLLLLLLCHSSQDPPMAA